eukprot:CAMPEP_0175480572 /NCGR_PEP_ID=MMETSP0095-20121207/78017_1 /TAXON_ID=311494 /ORGANISM="Alexandrium monilatum, Strain CCMP3105" /LENGTH=186 /DNA_ID=CAMNT_0016782205 /DNA_START=63 /DNA_END=620 /DNA_ORIENTATION=+
MPLVFLLSFALEKPFLERKLLSRAPPASLPPGLGAVRPPPAAVAAPLPPAPSLQPRRLSAPQAGAASSPPPRRAAAPGPARARAPAQAGAAAPPPPSSGAAAPAAGARPPPAASSQAPPGGSVRRPSLASAACDPPASWQSAKKLVASERHGVFLIDHIRPMLQRCQGHLDGVCVLVDIVSAVVAV